MPAELVEALGRVYVVVLLGRPAAAPGLVIRSHADRAARPGATRSADSSSSSRSRDRCVVRRGLRATSRSTIEELAHQASTTASPELPNRALFADRLGTRSARTEPAQGRVAVLFLRPRRLQADQRPLGHDAATGC